MTSSACPQRTNTPAAIARRDGLRLLRCFSSWMICAVFYGAKQKKHKHKNGDKNDISPWTDAIIHVGCTFRTSYRNRHIARHHGKVMANIGQRRRTRAPPTGRLVWDRACRGRQARPDLTRVKSGKAKVTPRAARQTLGAGCRKRGGHPTAWRSPSSRPKTHDRWPSGKPHRHSP
jgi:hypothetical protein